MSAYDLQLDYAALLRFLEKECSPAAGGAGQPDLQLVQEPESAAAEEAKWSNEELDLILNEADFEHVVQDTWVRREGESGEALTLVAGEIGDFLAVFSLQYPPVPKNKAQQTKSKLSRRALVIGMRLTKLTRLLYYEIEKSDSTLLLGGNLVREFLHNTPLTLLSVALDYDYDELSKCMVRASTKMYYKQTKFNLFREESEGFAKLIVELNNPLLNSTHIELAANKVRELIGFFLLDPNRVADLISSVGENESSHAQREGLIRLFKVLYPASSKSHFSSLIGFRLRVALEEREAQNLAQHLPRSGSGPKALLDSLVKMKSTSLLNTRLLHPPGKYLYDWIYELIVQDCIGLDMILAHLAPSSSLKPATSRDAAIAYFNEKHARQQERLVLEIAKLGEEEDAVVEANRAVTTRELENDHLAGLTASFLKNSNWALASHMFECFDFRQLLFNPLVQEQFCAFLQRELGDLEAKLLAPYSVLSKKHERPGTSVGGSALGLRDLSAFADVLLPILCTAGEFLSVNPALLQTVVRLLGVGPRDDAGVIKCLKMFVLPSLFCSDFPNASLSNEIWELLLSRLSANQRFEVYAFWDLDMESSPYKLLRKKQIVRETVMVAKRISTLEHQIKMCSSLVAKLSYNHPVVVFHHLIESNVIVFDNLMGPSVSCLKHVNHFGFDVISFNVLHRVAAAVKSEDGEAFRPRWLESLTRFTGMLFRSYFPKLDMKIFLEFIEAKFKANQSSHDLALLQALVSSMSGIDVVVEYSKELLNAQAGGSKLRLQSKTSSDDLSRSNGAYRALLVAELARCLERNGLFGSSLITSLALTMAKVRKELLFGDEHLPLTSNAATALMGACRHYDNVSEIFLQFTEFVFYYTKHEFPELRQLLDLGIDYVTAFHLCRKQKDMTATSVLGSPGALEPVHGGLLQGKPVSQLLFYSFWCLKLCDLSLATDEYTREINRLKSMGAHRHTGSARLDRVAREKEQARMKMEVEGLVEESKAQDENYAQIEAYFSNLPSEFKWFVNEDQQEAELLRLFELCLIPRARLSPEDALYSARYITSFLHRFSPVDASKLASMCSSYVVPVAIFSCTEREAIHLALFVENVLGQLDAILSSKGRSKREVAQFKFELFKNLKKNILSGLRNGQFIYRKQTLYILSTLVNVFPATIQHCQALESVFLEEPDWQKKNKNLEEENLFKLQEGYLNKLRKRRKLLDPTADVPLAAPATDPFQALGVQGEEATTPVTAPSLEPSPAPPLPSASNGNNSAAPSEPRAVPPQQQPGIRPFVPMSSSTEEASRGKGAHPSRTSQTPQFNRATDQSVVGHGNRPNPNPTAAHPRNAGALNTRTHEHRLGYEDRNKRPRIEPRR